MIDRCQSQKNPVLALSTSPQPKLNKALFCQPATTHHTTKGEYSAWAKEGVASAVDGNATVFLLFKKAGSKSIYRMHYTGLGLLDSYGLRLSLDTWKEREGRKKKRRRDSERFQQWAVHENTLRMQPDWEKLGGIKGAAYRRDDSLFCLLLNKSPIIIKSHSLWFYPAHFGAVDIDGKIEENRIEWTEKKSFDNVLKLHVRPPIMVFKE